MLQISGSDHQERVDGAAGCEWLAHGCTAVMQAFDIAQPSMGVQDASEADLPRSAPVKRVSPSTSEEGPLIEGPGKYGKRYKVC